MPIKRIKGQKDGTRRAKATMWEKEQINEK